MLFTNLFCHESDMVCFRVVQPGGCVSSPSHGGGMRWRMCQFPLTQRGYAVEDVSVPPHTEGVCGGGCVQSSHHTPNILH